MSGKNKPVRLAAKKQNKEQGRLLAKLRSSSASKEKNFRVAKREGSANEVDVYIYDVIGWPYIEASDLLYQIPKNSKTINVHINSPGGDVFEGMTIYNMLSDHKADVIVTVDGLAASSASLIAMAGDKTIMSKASFMMIHNPWSMMAGDADELRSEADLLDQISGVFAAAYKEKSGKSEKEILQMMKDETWFSPDEGVKAGFADEINGEVKEVNVKAGFDLSIFNNAPDCLRIQGAIKTTGEESMKKELRALLERLGLSKDATEDQAWKFLAKFDLDEISGKQDKEDVAQAQAMESATRKAAKDAAKAAVKEEKQRAADIREMVQISGLDVSFADTLIDDDKSVDEARKAVFEKMTKDNSPLGSGRITVGEEDKTKFKAAVVDGLSFRTNARAEKPALGHESFRAASFENVAKACLERAGVSTQHLSSRNQVANEILKRSASGGFSSDDFSSIFLDVANKVLLRAYQEAPQTWRPLVNIVSASDFKTMYGISLSEAPDLDLVDKDGEYKEGSMSDNQESYSIGTYGKIVYLTRQMIVDDDMRAFTRLPQLLGSSAKRKESDLVWAKITGNPVMSDGTALFHADHNNLESVAARKGVVDTSNLSTGRARMRKQKGMKGKAILDLTPKFLAVPVAQETSGDIILRSTALPDDNKSSGVHNPWANKLVPISEPRLDVISELAWYLIADPAQIDTIEVAYLDGKEEPYTEEHTLFERDALGYKIRHDFGCGIMDHRGFHKNAGV
ncbi:MAG: Clp protease ClpP [Desulfobacteraceae bacterium]|nr:Clp protease ClpP [Desulfobacteraceae bacterium]